MKAVIRNPYKISDPAGPVYDLITESGLCVSFLPLGAAIQKIAICTNQEKEIPLTLGFPKTGPYKARVCYAGATLCPNAGRIRGGRLPLLDKELQLSRNDGAHQLHGGSHNLSAGLWRVEDFQCGEDSGVLILSATQAHGLDGYPGNRAYQVKYTLTESGWLTIAYTAWTDRPTYINLSNHTYWNLTGDFGQAALLQELTIPAEWVCANDAEHLPVQIRRVAGTAFDFRRRKSLAQAVSSAKDEYSIEQLRIAHGFNHAYLLESQPVPGILRSAGQLYDRKSGRSVEVLTDAPTVVLYSGGFLPKRLPLIGGQKSTPSCAVALEAQDLPDCVHLLPEAYRLTVPEVPFRRIIQYRIHLS